MTRTSLGDWWMRLGALTVVFLQLYIYRHPEFVSRPWWAKGRIPVPVIRYFAVVWMVFFLLLFVLSFFVDASKLTIVGGTT